MDCKTVWPLDETIRVRDLGGHGDLLGDGPDEGRQFSGDGDHHLIGMFAACTELPVPFTQSYLRLPTDVLEAFREVFQAEWQMAAHWGRIAIRPGAFDQGPTGSVWPAFVLPPWRRRSPLAYSLASGPGHA